ncbi:MAG: hypothetical protein AAF726_04925 [Planctomycetota bacterium]
MKFILSSLALGAAATAAPSAFDWNNDLPTPPAPAVVPDAPTALSSPAPALFPGAPPAPALPRLVVQDDEKSLEKSAKELESEIARLREQLAKMKEELNESSDAEATLRNAQEQAREAMRLARKDAAEAMKEARKQAADAREQAEKARRLSRLERLRAEDGGVRRGQGLSRGEDRRLRARAFVDRRPGVAGVKEEESPNGGMTLRGRIAAPPSPPTPPGQSGGSGGSTFEIHVEEGDVHIHANGGQIYTSKGSGRAVPGGRTSWFGTVAPTPKVEGTAVYEWLASTDDEDQQVFFSGKPGQDMVFEVPGGQGTMRFHVHSEDDDDGDDDDDDGDETNGFVFRVDGESIFELDGTQDFVGLKNLGGIKRLDVLDDIDFDFETIVIDRFELDDISEEVEEALEEAFESIEEIEEVDVDSLFEAFDIDVDIEIEEEDETEEVEENKKTRRFILRGNSAPPENGSTVFWSDLLSTPAPAVATTALNDPTAAWPAPMVSAPGDDELLDLVREIRTELQAMRSEVRELRDAVLEAPVRRTRRASFPGGR